MTAQAGGDTTPAKRPYVQIEVAMPSISTYGWWPPCLGSHDHDAAPAGPDDAGTQGA